MFWRSDDDRDQDRGRDTNRERDAPYEEVNELRDALGPDARKQNRDPREHESLYYQQNTIDTEAVVHSSGWLTIRAIDDDDVPIGDEWYASDLAVTIGDWR